MNEILVHNNWDPLEEIWLGDVWPEHFYDDLDPEIRDAFYQITEWTKHDLNIIQKKLEEFNVIVRRPVIENDKSKYLVPNTDKLLKPPITPRDHNAVVNNKLYFGDNDIYNCYKPLLDLYPSEDVVMEPLSGAGTVKLGKDIIIDFDNNPNTLESVFQRFQEVSNQGYYKKLIDDYRVHFATGSGHCDGCFMPLRPGLILTTSYWLDYKKMFPDWRRIDLHHPTYANKEVEKKWGNFKKPKHRIGTSKWKVDNINAPVFNKYVEEHCAEWIGDYTETYFEVNIVMIDEKNMLCMGVHEELFNDLEKEGITCHVVPFRTRTFWDGGIHCITLDIRRRAMMEDYFPERGVTGLNSITTTLKEKMSVDSFLTLFHQWKLTKGWQ